MQLGRVTAVLTLSLVIIIGTFIAPAWGDASWFGHRPSSDSSNYTYSYRDHGKVVVSSTYPGSDVDSTISVENYQYQQNFANSGMDVYTLRLLAGETTRKDHTYSIATYDNFYTNCAHSFYCEEWHPGLNQGAWFDLSYFGWPVYFWGTAYTRIFVCSNGWAAFEFTGDVNNCGLPPTMPKPDYLDSNGNRVDLPDGIIAPLAKPLDDRPRSDGTTQGKIMIDYCGKYLSPNNFECGFGVDWNNVMTTQGSVRCDGGPCVNTFSFNFDGLGNLFFGNQFEDPSDRVKGVLGLEDASGYLAFAPDKATAFSKGGVVLTSPHYIDGNYFVGDSKIFVDKESTSDASTVEFLQAYVHGRNLFTTNPPPAQDNLVDETAGNLVEAAAVDGACAILGLEGWCIALEAGGILVGALVKYLRPQPTPPKYTISNILSASQETGYLEVPIVAEDPWGAWAADSMIYDVIQWSVPHDSGVHTLVITYEVQLGSAGPWRFTGVNLSVDAQDFGLTAGPVTPAIITQGSSASSTITLNRLNGFGDSVFLSAVVSPSGPTVSFNPSNVQFSTSTMTIQTTSSTLPTTYSIIINAIDPTGALTHSQTVHLQVVRGLMLSVSPNPALINQNVAVTVQTSDAMANVPVSFSAGLGTLSPTSCTTGLTGSCTVYFSSTTAGTSAISAMATGYQTGQVSVAVTDFGLSEMVSSHCQVENVQTFNQITVSSLNSFSGTVSMSSTVSPIVTGGPTTSWASPSVSVPSGSYGIDTVYINSRSANGTFTVTITGQFGGVTHSVRETVSVVSTSCPGSGGGGSVAPGTLITLLDGSQVPVQQLQVGMTLLSYDMTTHHLVNTTLTRMVTVVTNNQMVISTGTGKPLIVDQNPAQKLYVKTPDESVTLMSVTDLKIGYELFEPLSQTWVPIAGIYCENNGMHLMYDLYTTIPGNYIANGYLDPLKM